MTRPRQVPVQNAVNRLGFSDFPASVEEWWTAQMSTRRSEWKRSFSSSTTTPVNRSSPTTRSRGKPTRAACNFNSTHQLPGRNDLPRRRHQRRTARGADKAAPCRSGCGISVRRAVARCGAPALGAVPLRDHRHAAVPQDRRELRHDRPRAGICGCHVHVAVPNREAAVQVSNWLRPWLPLLLALTANSAIYRDAETGYASRRSIVWARWPSAGPRVAAATLR